MGRVERLVAFITGAARGQGRSHAVTLAAEGADIVAFDICRPLPSVAYALATEEDLDTTCALVRERGRRALAFRGDVRSMTDLIGAVEGALHELGRIDVICANAGIGSLGRAWELEVEQWQEMIDVNLTGAWLTVRAAVPAMIAAGRGGSIIFTNSIAGLVGRQNMAHYVAAKHGLVGLMRTLANELAPYRIRVNSIHPTNVDTDMIRNEAAQSLYATDSGDAATEFAAAATALNAIPVPWIEPSDVSSAVLWLASDESRYVTGAILPVDAGASIKSP